MLNTIAALNELAAHILPLAAPAPEPPTGGLNTQGIVSWIIANVVTLIIVLAGVVIIMNSRKGDYSKTFSTVGIIIIGLVLIGGVAALRAFADNISGLLFN